MCRVVEILIIKPLVMKEIILIGVYVVAAYFLFRFVNKKYVNNRYAKLISSVSTALLFLLLFRKPLVNDFQQGNYFFVVLSLVLVGYLVYRAVIEVAAMRKQ